MTLASIVVSCTTRRRHGLQKLFSAFPDGWPGLGLFLLRVAVAWNAMMVGYIALVAPRGYGFGANAMALGSFLVGLGLLAGFLTPLVGAIATCGFLVNGLTLFIEHGAGKHRGACPALDLAVMSLTLVLLGPGAFSIDARLFARREIIIHDGRHSSR